MCKDIIHNIKFKYNDISSYYLNLILSIKLYKSKDFKYGQLENCQKYNISIEYEFDPEIKNKLQFLQNLDLLDEHNEAYSGDIIHYNSLTNEMIKYLIMDNTELEKYSGRITPDRYKLQIIQSLKYFWD